MKQVISLFAIFLISATFQSQAQEVAQTNIKPISNSLEVISRLQPVSFNYDKAWADKLKLPSAVQYGFDGLGAKTSVPDLVIVQSKDYATGKNASASATITKVDYESLIPLLVGSIKEQQQQIEALKREIQTLKSQNSR